MGIPVHNLVKPKNKYSQKVLIWIENVQPILVIIYSSLMNSMNQLMLREYHDHFRQEKQRENRAINSRDFRTQGTHFLMILPYPLNEPTRRECFKPETL